MVPYSLAEAVHPEDKMFLRDSCFRCGTGIQNAGYKIEKLLDRGIRRWTCLNCNATRDHALPTVLALEPEHMDSSHQVYLKEYVEDKYDPDQTMPIKRFVLTYHDAPVIKGLTRWLEREAYNYSFRPNPWHHDELTEEVEFSSLPGAFFDTGPELKPKPMVVGIDTENEKRGRKVWVYDRYDTVERAVEVAQALNVLYRENVTYYATDQDGKKIDGDI